MPADVAGGLRVDIDLGSGAPPYEQIRAQVLEHVAAGRLVVGDRLPTIRALATDLGLAAGTVARAYRELEASGAVTTRRRAGTVVADGATSADVVARQAARDLVRTTRGVGLTDDAILAAVRAALRQEHATGSPNGPQAPGVS
ncbi:GntR family transcriptional regulator [Cellulosimicrobium terreum]|nr:GntR family transcriptional regulator [Cellulosimicrobium terreum]